jgi:flagellar biosynthesis protein FlhG
MRDFYDPAATAPQDQAHGLRRLFAGRRRHVLALAANPHVPFGSLVLDRLSAVLAAQGHEVLVVDAAETSPLPHELASVDLAACVESIAPRVSYLPARGLPMAYVDTRGSAGGFIDAAQLAAPQATVMLLHADGVDLARLLKHRTARPLLIGADHPESIKHAYANAKLLVRRCALMTFDLLLAAAPQSPRAAGIQHSMASCTENFLGAVMRHCALIDPAGDPTDAPDEALSRLLAAQLTLQDGPAPHAPPPGAWDGAAADARAVFAELRAGPPADRTAFR